MYSVKAIEEIDITSPDFHCDFLNIQALMEKGAPVSILFTDEEGEPSLHLFCELIQKARSGESFLIKNQGCRVGAYVLGDTEKTPLDYYYGSKRYANLDAARTATQNLYRITTKGRSIKIAPFTGESADILILFLKPERAMRMIQAMSFITGEPFEMRTGGIASICSDCTVYPLQGKIGISLGCKGSRKHSKYGDDEVVVGIPFKLAKELDEALGKIPGTND
ncbi:MAG: DUF169 domain-containing protein [Candidatus Methanoperedens sp.]|nr:DUF169 domain-containing protein [Candidatus Methanoperedens sp.]